MRKEYDVVIIGGGAAGLMAAGVAARKGHSVLVLEKMEKPARKVRITGKGRCNLTNICPREEFMEKVRTNAAFFAPAFDAFDNEAVVNFFRDEGVRIEIERGRRAFPESGKAWDIAQALADWATEGGAEIEVHTSATSVRTVGKRVNGVRMSNRRGFERVVECNNVILCTGGASYPATGSTGEGYGIAHALGHRIEEVRPSLVPLFSDSELAAGLDGVKLRNVNVRLEADGELIAERFGEMAFGTRGIEGPVILTLSRQAVDALIDGRQTSLVIDLKPALDEETIAARIERELAQMEEEGGEYEIGALLRKLMPGPMVSPFAQEAGIPAEEPVARLEDGQKETIIKFLKGLRIPLDDYGSFEVAVVTAGGVAVDEVDPHTMQSRLVEGLYFAGEVLDLDADTGGYNLQIAFSTGHLAGQLKK